ncbi:hypothetical protein [Methylobacterium sp. Leaf93]|uniref:hypothetical protein n=1 Tax=Methylobacterium sp. Leaf93 TaxID=1736249 RepID=UPI0006F21697|nr:hypothetical protein [Methylobacterium sp. Leaf93]KQP02670.1 hypothetical protein ASF26_14670 [Methylobacterium sp. Leaf93]
MPMTTDLPVGDLYEFIGDFRLNGDGPPTTGRMGLARLQEILLSSTSPVGALLANITGRLTTAEGFTNQITGIASRVTTLEGLAGISPGTDLAADGTAVRATRYWGRPGEAMRTWTADLSKSAKEAPPLTVTGAFSVTTDGPGKGPAIRITGEGYITTIAKIHLDDDEVVELTYRQARRINSTTGSNTAVNEVACYRADGTFITTAAFNSGPDLLVAEGLRKSTYRVSLVAALSSVALPAGTCFFSPLFGGRAGNGAIEITSIDRSTQSLTSAPEMADAIAPEDRLFIFDDSAKLIKKLSPLLLAQYVENLIVEKRFRFYQEPTLIGPEPKLWWANDLFRNGGEITHTGQTGTLLIGYGKPPVAYSAHSKTLGPGDWESFRDGSQQAIYLASADTTPIPVYSFFTNTSGVNPIGDAIADAFLARLSQTQNTAERAATRALIKRLYADGVGPYRRFRTAYLLAGRDPASSRVDMVREGKLLTLVNDPLHISNRGFQGNPGASAYFDLNYVPATDSGIGINNHAMGVYSDTTVEATGAFAMGAQNMAIGVNRSGPAGTGRSGSVSTDVVTTGGRGGLFALSRNAADKYRYIYGQTAQDVSRTTTAFNSANFSMLGLCNNGSTGPTAFTQTIPRFMFVSEYMTDAELFIVDSAMAEYMTAVGA